MVHVRLTQWSLSESDIAAFYFSASHDEFKFLMYC